VFRRLALEHVGAENLISEHTIVRAHDRAQPLLIKMFLSSNYGKRTFNATEAKVTLSWLPYRGGKMGPANRKFMVGGLGWL
jgi:hypothetical protein